MNDSTAGVDVEVLGARPARATSAQPGARADGLSGPSTNRGLCNFAESVHLGHGKAPNGLNSVDVKYLGIDTADFSLELSEDDLAHIEPVLLGLVGEGEVPHFDRRFVVSLVKLPYRYKVAVADGVELYVPSKGHAYLGMKVSAGARVCLSAEDLEREACDVMSWFLPREPEQLAGEVCLSRVDVCLDVLMHERAFQHINRLVARDSSLVVTRARKRGMYLDDGRYTGFWVGKGDVRLRGYDKPHKAKQDGSWDMWSTVYGRGEAYVVPEGYVVARFEWQLRRGYLRELAADGGGLQVRTLADFKRSMPSVLEYLCNEWFKLCGPSRGKDHKRGVLPIWSAIVAAFTSGSWSDIEVKVKRILRRRVPGNAEKLLGMAAGCLSSYAAIRGHHSGEDAAKSDADVLDVLRGYIQGDLERWRAGRDRRFKQLSYPSAGAPVYRDIWTGQPLPVPAPVSAFVCGGR